MPIFRHLGKINCNNNLNHSGRVLTYEFFRISSACCVLKIYKRCKIPICENALRRSVTLALRVLTLALM